MHKNSTITSSRLDIFRVREAGAGALLAAGLLVLASAPLFPASAAVTCPAPWVAGTLDATGNWTAGAGTDHRLACTGDTDGDVLIMTDDFPDPPRTASRLVIDVSDSNVDRVDWDFGTDFTDPDDDAGAFRVVLTGSLESSGGNNFDVDVAGFEVGSEGARFTIESFTTIDATGYNNGGIELRNIDADHTGTMEAINRGAITTGGGAFAYGMEVATQFSPSSSARAVNEGTIATGGDAGRAVFVSVMSGAGTAIAINRGTVTTTGGIAEAGTSPNIFHIPSDGVRANNDSMGDAEATNEHGGTVTVGGDGARGVSAWAGGGGTARATNRGAVIAGGDAVANRTNVFGVGAESRDGDAFAENAGSITVSGAGAQGISAVTFGAGTATVVAAGGRVTATHDDTDDDMDGVGIYASSGTGAVKVSIMDNAVIEAPQAVLLENAPATLSVANSVVRGRVSFGDGNDSFTIDNAVLTGDIATGGGDDEIEILHTTTMAGDIDFGAGEDTLTLDVSQASILTGTVTNLEYLNKMCPGDFVIDGDITFTGSAVNVMEGGLVFTGHVNLGTTGTLDVRDGTRVTALLTEDGTPRITAGMTTVHDGGAVVVEAHADAGETDAGGAVETLLGDANVQGTALPVQTRDSGGSLTQLAMFDPATSTATVEDGAAVGTRPEDTFIDEDTLPPPGAPDDGGNGGGDSGGNGGGDSGGDSGGNGSGDSGGNGSGGGGGGGGGGSTAFAIGGAGVLAALVLLFDWDADEPATAASLNPAFVQTVDGSSRQWVRNLAEAMPGNGAGSASGIEVGMDLAVGNGFTLGFVAAPDMAVARRTGTDAASLSGGRYSLRGGWRGETVFGKFSLSQAGWRVSDAYRNPTVGGGLSGSYDASQTDLQLGLGARVDLGRGLTLTPRMGAFAGELDRAGHTARGPVLHAAMPDVVQRYGGLKMGLGISSAWRQGPGEMKLRPSLKLSAARAWTDSPAFDLKQTDRLGIVSTTSRARLAGAPGTVFGLGAGLEAVDANGIRMGVRYGGAIMHGEIVHAAIARMKIAF